VKQIGKNRDAQLLATTSIGPRTSVMVEDEGQNPAPYLPDDLLVEILSRLPAKSLCRFKCASRSWRALTTDPAHRRRFAQTLSGIFFSRHLDGGTPATRLGWGFTALPSTPPPHACAWWGNGDFVCFHAIWIYVVSINFSGIIPSCTNHITNENYEDGLLLCFARYTT
jgi:hypothetical protein